MSFKLADVEKIYTQDPKLKREDIEALFEWLKKQPHLPEMSELQAVLFLHSCHYRMEPTKTTIDNYFTMRTSSEELFERASEEVIRRTLSICCVQPLAKRTPDGKVVLLMKFLDFRPEVYVNLDHLKLILMSLTLYFLQTGPANGLILLFDMEGITMGHLARISLRGVKLILTFVQEAAPTRLDSIHHINVSPLTAHLVALLKPFLKKEIYDQIKFHPHSIETLYEYVPKECLPEEYGGKLSPLKDLHDVHIQNMINNLDVFKWIDSQKLDKDKRPEKSRGNDLEGSFKKLDID